MVVLNVGVQSAQEMTKAVDTTAYTVDHAVYSHKLKAHAKADKLVEKSDKANVDALYEIEPSPPLLLPSLYFFSEFHRE